MQVSLGRNIVFGFIAAAIAVVTVHQGIVWLLAQLQVIKAQPWGLSVVPPYGVPQIVNGMFWGGLWGALFAVVNDKLPGSAMWIKGLIYGWIILVVSNWVLLPLIKGQVFGQSGQVLFAGSDPKSMLAGLCILGGFGLALGLIYGLLTGKRS